MTITYVRDGETRTVTGRVVSDDARAVYLVDKDGATWGILRSEIKSWTLA